MKAVSIIFSLFVLQETSEAKESVEDKKKGSAFNT